MTVGFTVRMMTVSALVMAAALSGCAGETDNPGVASAGGVARPSGSAAAPVDNADLGRKFARCMRAEGIDMPDPGPDGVAAVAGIPAGDTGAAKKMQAALEKCREFLPNGGEPPKMSADDLAKAREYAKCARENGMPDFPDPDPQTGQFKIEQSKVKNLEKMSTLDEKCQQFGAGRAPAIAVAE